jgi:hypothetical protein
MNRKPTAAFFRCWWLGFLRKSKNKKGEKEEKRKKEEREAKKENVELMK